MPKVFFQAHWIAGEAAAARTLVKSPLCTVGLAVIINKKIGAFLIVEIYGNYLKFPGPLDSRLGCGVDQNSGQQPTVGLNVLINM